MFGASQGFSFGQTAPEAPAGAKRARQEEKQTCVPVTVRILQDAVATSKASDSQEVLVHGSEAGIVHLVGVVEELVQQTAMTEFQLNDASGRIKVRHYASGAALGEGLEGLTAGRYVSVIGNLRTSPATHVSAMSFRAVTSADEVSYHMIEVALATLRLRNSTAGAAQPAGVGVQTTPTKRVEADSTISPMKVDAPMQVAAPESMMPARPTTDLRSSVLKLLREEQDNAGDTGTALANILAKLQHFQTPSGKVQQLLSELVNEGEIYTTIDDEHFSVM